MGCHTAVERRKIRELVRGGGVKLSTGSYLLNEFNASLQIHAEINELPVNAFLLVLLLLQHEHVVIEELLQTLIGVVNAELLKSVEL